MLKVAGGNMLISISVPVEPRKHADPLSGARERLSMNHLNYAVHKRKTYEASGRFGDFLARLILNTGTRKMHR